MTRPGLPPSGRGSTKRRRGRWGLLNSLGNNSLIMIKIKEHYSTISLMIATISLIVSISMGYLSFKKEFSEVRVEELTPLIRPFFSKKDHRWVLFFYHQIVISNTGGKQISLISIDNINMPILSIINDKIDKSKSSAVRFSFYLVNEPLENFTDTLNDKIDNLESIPLLLGPKIINIPIKPGESYIFRYAFKFFPYKGEDKFVDVILISFELIFNNGAKEKINRAIPVVKPGSLTLFGLKSYGNYLYLGR